MQREKQGSNHHFNAFYEDNGLLVQFILAEFIQVCQFNLQVKALTKSLLESTQASDVELNTLIQIFIRLTGNQSQQGIFSFPQWTKGCLTKLKDYCERHSYNTKQLDQQHPAFNLLVHQTWLAAIDILQLLKNLQRNSASPENTILFFPTLKRTVKSFQSRVNQMVKIIPQLLTSHWKNENVLQFFLQKKIQLSQIFGNDFLYKVLKCPLDSDEFSKFIIQSYHSRGFDSLPPKIKQAFVLESVFDEVN